MSSPGPETLQQALEQRLVLKLGATVAGREILLETRLMKRAARAEPTFWVQLSRGDGQALEYLINQQQSVEAWLSINGSKLAFRTSILKRDRQFYLTAAVMIDALLLKWPDEVLVVQHRKSDRMLINERAGVHAELFRTKGWTGSPGVYKDACKVTAELWDLSRGGASFVCPLDKGLLNAGADEPLLVSVTYYSIKVVLEARRVHIRKLSGAMRMGVKFVPGAGEVPGSMEAFRRIIDELEGRMNHKLFAAARAGMKLTG